eukprot:TRINITY_DN6409_c0_g1_i1.p1 TRINITY_DN6409_c0_g1~~TRINITY_DN6409_c0_g1_i1.p1  ORF type:complete len:560 (+),score=64.84 TRINITY_DN6409_c0_g1_i1:45-1682(+)
MQSEGLGAMAATIVAQLREPVTQETEPSGAKEALRGFLNTGLEPGENAIDPLYCKHCDRVLWQPRLLQCGHAVCADCLREVQSWPEPRCPRCCWKFVSLEMPPACAQLKELVATAHRAEAEIQDVLHFEGADSAEKVRGLVRDKPPTAAALCRLAEVELSVGNCDGAKAALEKAGTFDAGYYRIYQLRRLLHSEDSAACIAILAEGFRNARPVGATRENATFLNTLAALISESTEVTTEKVAQILTTAVQRPLGPRTQRAASDLPGCLHKLDCPICLSLFCDPITAHCGHTFCRVCLSRTLDHHNACPFCRVALPAYVNDRHVTSQPFQAFITQHFTAELQERRRILEAEEAEDLTQFPIFVCSVALPGVACPLHVFEPRYRLMMRRAWQGSRRFGMCAPTSATSYHHYGTALEIRSIEMLPDGRSKVDTIGVRRFRVLARGVRDGYNTAHIEWVDDDPEREERLNEDGRTGEIIQRVKDFVDTQIDAAALTMLERALGPKPQDDGLLSFWIAGFIREEYFQAGLLTVRTKRERFTVLADVMQIP